MENFYEKKSERFKRKKPAATYSRILLSILPLAKKGLTSEFGMGSGVSPSLLLPAEFNEFFTKKKSILESKKK